MTSLPWTDPEAALGRRPTRAASEQDTADLGYDLGRRLSPGDVVSLSGPLGCGKTVFVRGLARALAIREPITSPSFVIVQQYEGSLPLYHLDLYRLNSSAELEDLGFREMLSSDAVLAIEWGEKAGPLLPARRTEVSFSIAPDGSREILVQERR
jgi:tRNA threonylcarbamoyladenosine biosynthesis protein TsaE